MNLEQEVVMVADKYNSKSIPPKFLTAEAYTRKAARFGESNKREWLRLLERYGVLDVKPLAETVPHAHRRVANLLISLMNGGFRCLPDAISLMNGGCLRKTRC